MNARVSLVLLLGGIGFLMAWWIQPFTAEQSDVAVPAVAKDQVSLATEGVELSPPQESDRATILPGDEVVASKELEPVPKTTKPAGPATALIRVRRLLDLEEQVLGEGVSDVRVAFEPDWRGNRPVTFLGVTDALGELEAALPESGRFRLTIDDESMPVGLGNAVSHDVGNVPILGVSRNKFEIESGEHQELTIVLLDKRSIWGAVIDESGRGIPGAHVQALCEMPGFQPVTRASISNELGAFEIHGVLPLEYSLNIAYIDPESEEFTDCILPLPTFVNLRQSSSSGVQIRLERGGVRILGRVVDEEGHSFAGLDVRAYYAPPAEGTETLSESKHVYNWSDNLGSTNTDAGGSFVLTRIPRRPLRIQIGANAAMSRGRSKRLLARGMDVIEIDPFDPARVEWSVGTIEALRSHTYEVSGRISLTAERMGRKRLKLAKLKLEGSFAGIEEPKVEGWGIQRRPYVEFDGKTGDFVISCDTPRDEIVLRIYVHGEEEFAKELTFYPQADVVEENREITYP